eukprot:IDg5299t1
MQPSIGARNFYFFSDISPAMHLLQSPCRWSGNAQNTCQPTDPYSIYPRHRLQPMPASRTHPPRHAHSQRSRHARRFLYATGGSRGAQPLRPSAVPEWRPGLPLHWSEQTRPMKLRALVVRLLAVVHIAVSVAYLQYRARRTIGVFESSRHPGWRFAQILFYCYEVFVAVFALLQLPEHWNVMKRRSVDFDRVPRHLFAAPFDHPEEEAVPNDLRHYPSIAVIIPCYREDVGLVRLTVEAALALDYPRQLLSVYLCDDGRDPDKEAFIARLQRTHPNVNYVARPNNDHAKPGNVNYTLERTRSHFVVQLDADFVARPQLIQRLLPYYFVWNADLHAYEY